MRLRQFASYFVLLGALCTLSQAGTPGSFRGKVVEGAQGTSDAGWLYVQGRDGSVRRVDISHASVGYDDTVPADQRKPAAREQLAAGAEVRVTAEQGRDGEWRASRVDILKTAPSRNAAGLGSEAANYVACAPAGSFTNLPCIEV